MDLFLPIFARELLNDKFLSLLIPSEASARAVLTDWAQGFEDPDGEFIQKFQAAHNSQTMFNSAFWNLYLFAVLKLLGIEVDFTFKTPDFVCARYPMAIEAAVANHSESDTFNFDGTIASLSNNVSSARRKSSIILLSNALMRKSQIFKRQHGAFPHMARRPYVVAVASFGMRDYYLGDDHPMHHILYDAGNEKVIYKTNGAQVSLGLFGSAAFSHISAVLYSSLATWEKVEALRTEDSDMTFRAIRRQANAEPFCVTAHKRNYEESLTDGLVLYTNPYASFPLDLRLFNDPGIRRYVAHRKGSRSMSCHDGGLYVRTIETNVGGSAGC